MNQLRLFTLLVAQFFLLLAINKTTLGQSFTKSNLQGINVTNPTSLQFGPDGRLYLSQQDGTLYACEVTRSGDNSYTVTSKETILLVKNIKNYNDDGSPHTATSKRQVTGVLVAGSAEFPVLYVGSSDYRVGGGTSKGDLNLDTNSGIISRLTWNGSAWEMVHLVRGLPRSEENHANNGMQLDPASNTLYVASGGNTNAGAPSNNFAFITEYALAAAILAIDLDDIESKPIYTDPRSGEKFIYDIPTLDDPTRPNIDKTNADFPYPSGHPLFNAVVDVGDPFGGNDGLNQAKIVVGGPVQVFAAGFRNIYDLALTEDGRLYTWDNGANSPWGGHPHQEGGSHVTNNWLAGASASGPMTAGWVGQDGILDKNINNKDGLHFVGYTTDYNPFSIGANPADAYYGGHPTPVRANPAGAGLYTHDHAIGTYNNNGSTGGFWRTQIASDPEANSTTSLPADWPPVPVSKANPVEGDFQNPGQDNVAIWSFEGVGKSFSTNGLVIYRASNFNGDMQGHLLAAAHNNTIYEISLNGSGTINNPRVPIQNNPDVTLFGENFGDIPLDITAQADGQIFQGTVWVANYVSNTITVFEPQDYFDCPLPGEQNYNPTADYDQDGYKNQDEIDTGSDPCNGASQPKDADGDLIPDSLDPDDDNDGIADVNDNFQLDANNGLTTRIPINYPLLNGDPGTGIAGLGFTGLMNNGDDYLTLIRDKTNSNVIVLYGGAPGQLGMGGTPGDPIPPGDAYGSLNSQKNAFQFGVNVTPATPPFTVRSELVGPIFGTTPQGEQSAGIYIGTGDQDNYLKIVANANGGSGGILVVQEDNGNPVETQYDVPAIVNASSVEFMLSVNPSVGTIQPKYSLAGGGEVALGSPIQATGDLLSVLQNGQKALAIGVIATSRNGTSQFATSWDNIVIEYDPIASTGSWQTLVPQSGSPTSRVENAYVQVGDKFYLIGGRDSQGKKVDIYDPATKTWTKSASNHPVEMHHFQAVAYKGLIYVMGAFTGGYPSETPLENLYIYNPANDTWHEGNAIPRPRGSTGAVLYDNKIYLVGGLLDGHKGEYVQWFDEYDPKTGKWKTMPNLPRFRDHFQAAVFNNRLVLAGGRLSDADKNLAAQNYPNELIPDLPPGGTGVFNVTVPEVDIFNFASNTWINATVPDIPTPRAGTASAVIGNEVVVIGGESGASTDAHDDTEAFNVATNTWRTLANMLPEQNGEVQGRHATQAIVNNGGIYLAAGSGKQGGYPLNSQQVFFFNSQTSPTGTATVKSSLSTSVSSLAFGDVSPGQQKTKTTTLTNTSGNQSIYLIDFTVSGDDAFQLVTPPDTRLLLPGQSATLNLLVNPSVSDQGDITANLTIHSTASSTSLTIPLSASVVTSGGNLAPQVTNPVANITIDEGADAQSIDLLTVFDDDQGPSNLTFTATSGNENAVTTTVSNSTLSLQFGSSGSSSVTVTATDSEGESVSDVFVVTINELPGNPTIVNPIDGVIVGPNAPAQQVALEEVFADDGGVDNLSFTATSNNPSVVTASVSQSTLTLSFSNTGSALVTVIATDEQNLQVSNEFSVIVNDGTTPLLALNAGGGQVQHDGVTWQADAYFIGGQTYMKGGLAIAGTDNDKIYQSERWGPMSYNIPVANGSYQLALHFAEIYLKDGDSGQRVFDVMVEGQKVLTNFDILSKTTSNTAWIETIAAQVSDGELNISFTSTGAPRDPKLSAIALYGGSSTPTNQPPMVDAGPNQTLTLPTNSVTLAATASDNDGSIASYQWTKVSGPSASLSGAGTSQLTAANLVAGSYTFRVTVTDDDNATANDQVQVVVNESTGGGGDALLLALNAGGGQVQHDGVTWQADAYFIGGQTYMKGGLAIAGTDNDKIYQSERWGPMSYNIPVANGSYQLALHFAEIYLKDGDSGQRVFDVMVEGQKVLTNFDILSKTTSNTAWIETIAAQVSDGELNISFTSTGAPRDPKLSAIALYGGSSTPTNQPPMVDAGPNQTLTLPTNSVTLAATASDNDGSIASYQWTKVSGPSASLSGTSTQTLTASDLVAGNYVFRVNVNDDQGAIGVDQVSVTVQKEVVDNGTLLLALNAGGGQVQHDGVTWQADAYFIGGQTYMKGGLAIAGTDNDKIYQSERWGPMSYNIPVANGSYQLALHFAEIYLKDGDSGQRVFDVMVEGQKVLTNFDILSKTTSNTAWIETIAAQVSDGELNISFTSTGAPRDPKLSALAVFSGGTNSQTNARLTKAYKQKADTSFSLAEAKDDQVTVYPIPFADEVTIAFVGNIQPTSVKVALFTALGIPIALPPSSIMYGIDEITLDLSGNIYKKDMIFLLLTDQVSGRTFSRKLLREN